MEGEYWCHGCQRTVRCSAEVLCLNCGSPAVEEVKYRQQVDIPAIVRNADLPQLTERLRMLFDMLNEAVDVEEDLGMQDEDIDILPAVELEEQCPICLDQRSDPARKLPCGHTFHDLCLRNWLKAKAICPTCKRSVVYNDCDSEFE